MPDPEERKYLLFVYIQFLSYNITNDILYFAVGSGENDKNMFFNLINSTLHPFIDSVAFGLFTTDIPANSPTLEFLKLKERLRWHLRAP
jgi:hypothetical protein